MLEVLKAFLLVTLLIRFTKSQYQNCFQEKESGTIHPVIGNTGQYEKENSIGVVYGHVSFLVNNSSELFVGLGYTMGLGYSNRIWKYSISLKKWKFLKGTKTGYSYPIIDENDVKKTHIGGKLFAVGWKNNEETLFFFGGYGYLREDYTLGNIGNDLWMYNMSNNIFSNIFFPKNILNQTSSVYGYLDSSINQYSKNNVPGGRYTHNAIKINEKETIMMFGTGYKSNNQYAYLDDYWIFSSEKLEWKKMGGSSKTEFGTSTVFGETNVYNSDVVFPTSY